MPQKSYYDKVLSESVIMLVRGEFLPTVYMV